MTLFDCLVPKPVTFFSVSDASTTTITAKWTSSSSEGGNYVTYYKISHSPSCPELSSMNATLVSVTPHQFTTTFSYTLKELFRGMNHIITVRAGNILGESNPMMILGETDLILSNLHDNMVGLMLTIIHRSRRITYINYGFSLNKASNNITWEEIDCHLHNGRIIDYIVIISNNIITYNLISSERYVIMNYLVIGNVYNMSVAGANSIGRGPFSDPVEVQIGTSKFFVCLCEQQLYFLLSPWSS